MTTAKQIQKIVDQLIYNQLYAPDYPSEDCTDTKKEEKRILSWLDDVLRATRREDIGDWLRASQICVEKAFVSLDNADRKNGLKEIEFAIQYMRNAVSQKPHKVDFIGKSNDSTIFLSSSDEVKMVE